MKSAIALALTMGVAGCTTSHGFVNYKTLGVYASESAGNKGFQDVGPINATQQGFVWDNCDFLAEQAVRNLLDTAKVRGADTVYKIMFNSKNGPVTSPTCTTGWAWFLLSGIGGLGPWVQQVSVEGVAAKLGAIKTSTSSIAIPEGADTAKLARDYIQGRYSR